MADKKTEVAAPTPEEFMARVNKAYDGNVIQQGGGQAMHLKLRRMSSGILSLDCALGGGWAFSRIQITAGEYSTGKTLIALKAAEQVEQYDHATHLRKDQLPAGAPFTPGRCLFVDVEHAFDETWAVANGWNKNHHYVAKPEYAEQAIDLITDAIRDNVFDLIIVDSVAAMTPSKEIDESSEDWQMALGARLMNKAVRKWNGSLAKLSQQSNAGGPCLMLLNQFRLKMGVMFGDPRTMPHGKGQEFAAAIIVYTKGAKVVDDAKEDHGFGEYGGVVYKNKTFLPKCNYVYRMSLKDQDGWGKGEIDNLKQAMALGRKYGLITRPPGSTKDWTFNGEVFRVLDDIETKFATDPAFRILLWRSIVSAFGGQPC